jgi:MerR family redox-sensitive transcriptional activator SoxR
LRPSAVRYYERLGLLPLPRRVNGRRYNPNIVRALTVILFARRAGFSLAEIRRMFGNGGVRIMRSGHLRESAREKLVELDATIEHLQHMKGMLECLLDCACRQLDECVMIDRTWWPAEESPSPSLRLTLHKAPSTRI